MKIGVVGAGSWGTTIADMLALNGHDVTLWVYEADLCERMRNRGENDLYLPGFALSKNIKFTNSIEDAVSGTEMVVSAAPAQVVRRVISKAVPYISANALIVSLSKGIEEGTLMLMSDLLKEALPNGLNKKLCFLSGPRVYTHDDVTGVELGGAVKNVIAIATGIADGLGFGYNSRAALITRGLAEISRLGAKMGANPLTFSGLAGLGDLVLTCTGELSRNRTVGYKIGKGATLEEVTGGMNMVAEGVATSRAVHQLSKKIGIEMPITEHVYKILYEGLPAKDAVINLMSRDLKREVE
ncbi:MAG: NAD(P)-dependent glycerol-3-phosphate dehydrogenase [Deltaproteobacteria bacterium]|nr:NAD(P)-dependent glycerol-3-phosphate dehydrogenase [Deltaproteobacteria bacterium]